MTKNKFQTCLNDFTQQINCLPEAERQRLMELVEETNERRDRAHAATAALGDAIGSLRLSAQYLAFDLWNPPDRRCGAIDATAKYRTIRARHDGLIARPCVERASIEALVLLLDG